MTDIDTMKQTSTQWSCLSVYGVQHTRKQKADTEGEGKMDKQLVNQCGFFVENISLQHLLLEHVTSAVVWGLTWLVRHVSPPASAPWCIHHSSANIRKRIHDYLNGVSELDGTVVRHPMLAYKIDRPIEQVHVEWFHQYKYECRSEESSTGVVNSLSEF